MTSPPPDEPFVTAEEAIFELDLATNGMGQSGHLGMMTGDEARKLATHLFADDTGELPEELICFFNFPQEGS